MQRVSEQLPDPGRYAEVIFPAQPQLPVWIYHPQQLRRTDRVIIAIHGISRDGEEQVREMAMVAERLGCWLLAPVFNREVYPTYQQLGKGGSRLRADIALNTLLSLWRAVQGLPGLKVWLTGYSGGAQFAHRYALHYPEPLAALVVSSSGWYTFPDARVDYPRGLRATVALGKPKLDSMLSLPILITVGEADDNRDTSLRQAEDVDQQQGLTRFSRALSWAEAIRKQQFQKQLRPASLKVLAGEKHSFQENMQQGGMAEIIYQFLLETEGEKNENNKCSVTGGYVGLAGRVSDETRKSSA